MSKIQFLWEGKEKALLQHLTPPSCTYEIPNDIQGNEIHCVDNLDFLKNNKERLAGKVKCIYIDPPYNTGSDFIYNDKMHKGKECKHSKWLSFMYPRLVLARELLREDGVIFISIDDNEQANLRLLMNEVFGEGEFVSQIIWKKKHSYGRGTKMIIPQTEYVLCYTKDIEMADEFTLEYHNDKIDSFDTEDEKGKYRLLRLWHTSPKGGYVRKTLQYILQTPDGKNVDSVTGQWLWNKERMDLEMKNNNIVFIEQNDGSIRAFKKDYLTLDRSERPVSWYDKETSDDGTKLLNNIIPELNDSFFPKPIGLVKHFINISTAPNDLVLDFFAGSGTTGQAVMELNFEETQKAEKDGLLAEGKPAGGRKFILVQLPEKISESKEAFKAGYRVISDITMERVRRAGAKYKNINTNFKIYQYE